MSHIERPFVSRRDFLRRTALVRAAAATGPWIWRQPAFAAQTSVEQVHLTFGSTNDPDQGAHCNARHL